MPTLKPKIFQPRWQIPAVLAVTIVINYFNRNNLSLALPRLAQDFGWSDREVGSKGELLLAAFYVSYALSNMLMSPAAERFGPKRSVMMTICAFSLVTILSAPLGYSLSALIVLRLLLGLGEGVHIPMASAITSRWFLSDERSRANAIWVSGILLSTSIAPIIIVPLIHLWGWRSTFAGLGIGGMLLSLPLIYFLIPDEPSHIASPDAVVTATDFQQQKQQQKIQQIAYRQNPLFWLMVTGGSLNAFCSFGLLNWLPTYFNRAKGIDFEQLGWPLALVYTAGMFGIALMAYLGDKLQGRIQLAGMGFLMAGGMVYIASTTTQAVPLVLFFAGAVFCQSAYGAQEYAIVQRILPVDRVGAGTGLYNGLAVLLGGVGGSLIPGTIVAMTGSFDAGILSIVVGAWLASGVMFVLAKSLRY
ncbi:MFS transporter [Altericista sp. CCNU0014]|uniref:MFS transporter n=1 Tax=Altericista sp. CCNU0014 TaxID=3082949 RepID=UPI00384AB5CE